MIIEIHFETKFPDIYINGVGLFHHLWLHVRLAYSKMVLRTLDYLCEIDERQLREEEPQA